MENNKLTVFTNEDFGEVRTVEINGEPWFVAVDVCRALEIKNSRDAVSRLDEDERGVVLTDTLSGKQEMNVVNEPGLYSLVLGSRKPEAKAFKRWITHEVIPAIRKTGYYAVPQDYISALRAYADELERNQQLEAENQEQKLVIGMQEQEIADLRPMKTYVDTILESTDTLTVTQIAADYGLTAQKLNKILKNENIQRKVGGQWVLKANQMGQGYTDSKTVKITHTDGTTGTVLQTRWTQKGRLFIHEILSKHGIVALMDREEYDE